MIFYYPANSNRLLLRIIEDLLYLQMQNLDISVVNSPSATDTKDGSAFQILQSFEIRITALDWIMLLREMVTERILEECEGKFLEKADVIQLGTSVCYTALRYFLGKAIPLQALTGPAGSRSLRPSDFKIIST
jgi:hypothetical protein